MIHDPLCYVVQDPIMQIVFHDGCRVCTMLQKARDDERARIIQQISAPVCGEATTQPL